MKKTAILLRDGNDKDGFPYLYIGGAWVVSNPTGRPIEIQFPADPETESLMITDIYTGLQQLPHHSKRIKS